MSITENGVFEVTMENFEEIVETHPIVILDFWAEWCAPCKAFAPAFKIMAENTPNIFFGSVNTEVAVELAQAFQVRSIPTLMAFKNGDLVFELAGLLQAEKFQSLIDQLRQ